MTRSEAPIRKLPMRFARRTLFWKDQGASMVFDHEAGLWIDHGPMTRAEAEKFCYLRRCRLVRA